MTCTNLGFAIVCTNPFGRLKVGNRYVWVDYHTHTGPAFSWDRNGAKTYEPVDENDPVWAPFLKWLDRLKANKAAKAAKQRSPKDSCAKRELL